MHVLAARCDPETGKSLNIAPPGRQKTFGPLRDGFNHTHGWSRPDDPARARASQPGHRALINAAKLQRLGESLSSAASSAQRSIDADMAAFTECTRSVLMRAWLFPAAAGLSLFLVICVGSWATMRWLSMQIESQLQTLAILSVDIEQARQTLTELETATWRIELVEIDGERFVVLPPGSLERPPWRVGGRSAVKLSGE